MIRCLKIVLVILFLVWNGGMQAQENLTDYSHSLRFARYLSAGHQYSFAAQEYERLLFLFPRDTIVIYELAQTYRKQGRCGRLNRVKLLVDQKKSLFQTPLLIEEYIRFAYKCGETENLKPYLTFFPEERRNFLELAALWSAGRYDTLRHFTPPQPLPSSPGYRHLWEVTKDFQNLKYKKTGLALAMSAVIPGSGKIYAGYWRDGIMAFLFTAGNLYMAYHFYTLEKPHGFNTWLFGFFGISFYAGNLFGSYKAAKDHNRRLNQMYREKAEAVLERYF